MEMKDAIYKYSNSIGWNAEIRRYNREGGKYKPKDGYALTDVKRNAELCEEFITKSPKWNCGVTFRGMSVPQETYELFDEAFANKEKVLCVLVLET